MIWNKKKNIFHKMTSKPTPVPTPTPISTKRIMDKMIMLPWTAVNPWIKEKDEKPITSNLLGWSIFCVVVGFLAYLTSYLIYIYAPQSNWNTVYNFNTNLNYFVKANNGTLSPSGFFLLTFWYESVIFCCFYLNLWYIGRCIFHIEYGMGIIPSFLFTYILFLVFYILFRIFTTENVGNITLEKPVLTFKTSPIFIPTFLAFLFLMGLAAFVLYQSNSLYPIIIGGLFASFFKTVFSTVIYVHQRRTYPVSLRGGPTSTLSENVQKLKNWLYPPSSSPSHSS
jgi:hypothetical protein